ncbi:hypothetical protein Dsin_007185 [Dipteronia sinensis]|uniref:Malectin-like domain-containing protein n=1 Tax=Dipteronia sinensis TaxID=43782 RepID=A0AAE0AZM7_9ROSI|nr:hypothetical protein Dsin_007185 [Dipteronia sinensis]
MISHLSVILRTFNIFLGNETAESGADVIKWTQYWNGVPVYKDYAVLVLVDGETLNIKFTPSTNSFNAYTFVNEIEVMSIPDIYNVSIKLVCQDSWIDIDYFTSLENVYRINMGGNDISHFSDTGEGLQQDLWPVLHLDLSSKLEYDDAILNGVEIFKISDTDFNLAGANPISGPQNVVDLSKVLPSTRASNSRAVDGETLNIKFTPSTNSFNAYTFVNEIEVMSMPDIYNPYRFGETFGVAVTTDQSKTIITYPKDMPTYVAPEYVYSTTRSMGPNPQINKNYSLTWIFSVDVGFVYMVRLHFCEVQAVIIKINQRRFDIFLGNETVESGADVIKWMKFQNGVPVYKNYAVLVSEEGPQQDLWLALHPDLSSEPQYDDAILNGVEIFKLSDTYFNLVRANPIPGPQNVVDLSKVLTSTRAGNLKAIIGGGVGGGLALVFGFCVFAASRHGKDHSPSAEIGLPKKPSLPSNLCRHFSLTDIEERSTDADADIDSECSVLLDLEFKKISRTQRSFSCRNPIIR